MSTDITPPPELVQQWASNFYGTAIAPGEAAIDIATQAARWGADQARRPKQPSLKEQALAKLEAMERLWEASGKESSDTIRRALEQLP